MLIATARVMNPDNVTIEITLSLTVSEWKEIAKQLPDSWPHWQVGGAISKAIGETVTRISQERVEVSP